jgi:hypothetical protein
MEASASSQRMGEREKERERESMAVTIHFLNTTRVPLGEHLSVPLRNAHHKVSSEDAKGSRGLGWPSEVPLGDGDE